MLQTRKIELWVQGDKETKVETWNFLRMIDNTLFQVANTIVNEQNFNNHNENRIINKDGSVQNLGNEIKKLFRKKYKTKDKEEKDIIEKELQELKLKQKELKEIIYAGKGNSKQNTTYKIIGEQFPEIPPQIRNCLNSSTVSVLNSERNDVENGIRSIRSYKKGMPIPFGLNIKNFYLDIENNVFLKWFNNINFYLRFGRDKSNNRIIVERILEGQYKPSISSIQIVGTRIFLLMCFDMPKNENILDKSLCVGIDLGINTPAYWALSEGFGRGSIGNKNDFLRIRTQQQKHRRELSSSLKIINGGKGRSKKLKALDKFRKSERNFVHTYNHNLTKEIISIAKRTQAGTIKLELLDGYGRDKDGKSVKEKEFVLRNWSYFEVQSLLKYKAEKEGIDILYIDPYHTSQTCALCGHYEEGQRLIQSEFICKNQECENFEKVINADFNAALNIAKSDKVVQSKEDCAIYKNKKVSKEMVVGSCIIPPNQVNEPFEHSYVDGYPEGEGLVSTH